jgi:hypothetical protein
MNMRVIYSNIERLVLWASGRQTLRLEEPGQE